MSSNERPYVLTIAGFDPSGGAGVLADIKTFEQHKVQGLGVCTAVTVQNDSVFEHVKWEKPEIIKQQIEILFRHFEVNFCKIGLIENWPVLNQIVDYLLELNPDINIVVDPITKASAGFDFHHDELLTPFFSTLSKLSLLTPNIPEMQLLTQDSDLMEMAVLVTEKCPVLLKGGHAEVNTGTDFLLVDGAKVELEAEELSIYDKHGTGCILSAAITANLANGLELEQACQHAKGYLVKILDSNSSLLAYHNND